MQDKSKQCDELYMKLKEHFMEYENEITMEVLCSTLGFCITQFVNPQEALGGVLGKIVYYLSSYQRDQELERLTEKPEV